MSRLASHFFALPIQSLLALSLIAVGAGCSTAKPAAETTNLAAKGAEDYRKQIDQLQSKLDSVETRLSALTDKVDANRTSLETLDKTREPEESVREVKSSPIDHAVPASAGTPAKKLAKDPDAAFSSEAPILAYRKAMVLFESGKLPDAVLGFSQFLDQYADHPWAGSAQYFIGLSYVGQKECKLAIQEFNRVLTSYDRSPHVADALSELVKCEEGLKLSKQASQHRQMLFSLYPNSPAAARTGKNAPKPAAEEPNAAPHAPSAPATAPVPGGVKEEPHPS